MTSVQTTRFIPLTISWNLTKRCNLACVHCYIEASAKAKTERELTPDQCLTVLDQIAKVHPEAFLILTGGEPLLRPDLFHLIRRATDIGFYCVLGSHGGLLDESVVHRLKESGLKGVGVSVDAVEAEAHDKFRGIRGAWQKTMNGITVMRKLDLDFLVETTVTPHNVDEIEQIADLSAEVGSKAFNLFFLVPTGRGASLTPLSPEQHEDMLKRLAVIQKKYAGRMLVNAKCAPHYRRVIWEDDHESPFVRTFQGGGCPAGTFYCRITPEGDVTPCPYMPLTVGNVLETPFDQLWETSSVFQEFRSNLLKGRCGACEFTDICGGCRCRALATTGDYLAEDPSCTYQPGAYGGERIRFDLEKLYGAVSAQVTGEVVRWTPEAEAKLKAVPFFVRGMVRQAVERHARKAGHPVVTEELMAELRSKMPARFTGGKK